ncbi:MAG: hypothetical protein NTZ17_16600 [Phycisphaerae bacterium]|nr:hypothetical protein [Phycisphaerae bacterium]
MNRKLATVLDELKAHAPFTLFGSLTGIAMMLLFQNLPETTTYRLFYVFHPLHVTLSAIVAGSIFRLHERAKSFFVVLLVGYLSSVGTATLSNSIIPFFGESILGVAIPTESEVHAGHGNEASNTEAGAAGESSEHRGPKIHLGFIEEWYIVNPAAVLGILIGFFLPRTKLPHAGHILVSTWASAAHILMNTHTDITILTIIGMVCVLFVAVWVPCCSSDIVFPLLFVRSPHLHTGHDHAHEEVHA